VGRRQAAKLVALRDRRDNAAVTSALTALEAAARGSENVMPRILAAVEAYATLGEISDTMRRVFGEQHSERTM
jgi:methylmalonyl-CoA mutase N-terminal domain/subunit